MPKNDYLARRNAELQKVFDVGTEMGMQRMWDYVQMALRDPDTMGRDTFGPERLEKLYNCLMRIAEEYHTAFTDSPEADYAQERMDRILRPIWGDRFSDFAERYPYIRQSRYDKPMKKWRR